MKSLGRWLALTAAGAVLKISSLLLALCGFFHKLCEPKKVSQALPIEVVEEKMVKWPIAFGPFEILPGKTEDFQCCPQGRFLGEKLINTGSNQDLYVTALKVGMRSQIPTEHLVHVNSFDYRVVEGNEISFDTCESGLSITISVLNKSTTPQVFSATLFGAMPESDMLGWRDRLRKEQTKADAAEIGVLREVLEQTAGA